MFTKVNSPVKFMVSATSALARAIACAVFLLVFSLAANSQSDSDYEGLEHWLTAEQIETFGLSGLSRAQEQALSNWIGEQLAVKAQLDAADGGQMRRGSTAKEFEARVMGDVSGWSGNAVFKLDNGQVWVQRGSERSNKQLSNPSVSIKQNFLGFYVMTFTDTGQKVRVKRRQ